MPDFIRCDGSVTQTNNGVYYRCRLSDGATVLSESEVQELYSSPRMDNEDFQLTAEHATLMFIIALGIKYIRKLLDE